MNSNQAARAMRPGSVLTEVRSPKFLLQWNKSSLRPSVSYDEFKIATEAELKPMRVHEGTIGASSSVWAFRPRD